MLTDEDEDKPQPLANNSECDGCKKPLRLYSQGVLDGNNLCWTCFTKEMDRRMGTTKKSEEEAA